MTAGTSDSGTQTPSPPMGQPILDGAQSPYTFPTEKLKRQLVQPGKTPLVLVACGSFSPITYLHLRMFEMASDFVRFNTDFEVCAGYLSPVWPNIAEEDLQQGADDEVSQVSDAYKKVGLAPGSHRVNMCGRAVEQSPWLMVDPFETVNSDENGEPQYVPTAKVLRHFDHEINTVLGGIEGTDGQMKKARIALLAGADLVMSMGEPGLWAPKDLATILGSYGAFIIERSGTDIDEALASLRQYEDNIWVISQVIQNDISSTKVRLFLKKDLSVRYLIPDPVVDYINEHGLFESNSAMSRSRTPDVGPEPSNSKPIKG